MTEVMPDYTPKKKTETRGAKNARLAQEAFARSRGLTKPTKPACTLCTFNDGHSESDHVTPAVKR